MPLINSIESTTGLYKWIAFNANDIPSDNNPMAKYYITDWIIFLLIQ